MAHSLDFGLTRSHRWAGTVFSRARRLCRISCVLLRHFNAFLSGHLLPHGFKFLGCFSWSLRAPQDRLRDLIQDLGGVFVKLGQMMALRTDLIPQEYSDALLDLIDHAPPFSYEQVENIFKHDLGCPPQSLFDRFEKQPFATGSIGQVHRAWHEGRALAVKVRRPDSELSFAVDVGALWCFVTIIRWSGWRCLSWLDKPLSEFIEWTRDELDYRREAANARALGQEPHHSGGVVPEVFLASEQIIALDFLNGPSILEQLPQRRGETLHGISGSDSFDHTRFARNLIRCFLRDAFERGTFHADPHPGNLMVLSNDTVGYVDFGICGVLSPSSRRNLIGVSLAYSSGDLEDFCASFLRVCDIQPDSEVLSFWRDLQKLATRWHGQNPRGFGGSVTSSMMQLFELCREYRILPKRDVVRYIKAAICLESVLKLIQPGLDIYSEFSTVLMQHPAWMLPSFVKFEVLGEERSPEKYDEYLAGREFMNMVAAVRHFGVSESEGSVSTGSDPPPTIEALRVVDPYYALWAMEGWGFSAGLAKASPGETMPRESSDRIQLHDQLAVHVGRSLACARRLLLQEVLSVPSVVSSFISDCKQTCPLGCEGISIEALGFAVRTLRPGMQQDVTNVLSKEAVTCLPFFWHGVGRATYFLFPRALDPDNFKWNALMRAASGADNSLARNNLLAGFAWPLFLVNVRHPEILAHFLSEHGTGLLAESGFVHGLSAAISVWVTWAGDDTHLRRLKAFSPQSRSRDFIFMWQYYVIEPAIKALAQRIPTTQTLTSHYGQLFRYVPDDPLVA